MKSSKCAIAPTDNRACSYATIKHGYLAKVVSFDKKPMRNMFNSIAIGHVDDAVTLHDVEHLITLIKLRQYFFLGNSNHEP